MQYTILEEFLEAFWSKVVQRSNTLQGTNNGFDNHFRNPFLVVSGHGLKLFTKRDGEAKACVDFLAHLDQCFQFKMDMEWEAWFDLGVEDVPKTMEPSSTGVTFLRKMHCLDSWAKKFASPNTKSDYLKITKYHWLATRDARSVSTELLPTNSL